MHMGEARQSGKFFLMQDVKYHEIIHLYQAFKAFRQKTAESVN